MEIAPILATISFIVQKIIEIIQPALEKYIKYFRFETSELKNKVEEIEKIYKNTMNVTRASDIQIEDNEFKYNPETQKLIDLKNYWEKKLRRRQSLKVRRYLYFGSVLGILICLVVSKFGGVQFIYLSPEYAHLQNKPYFWIISSIGAGIIVGLGSKPVNDILDYFKR